MAFTRRRASPIWEHSGGEADLFGLFTASRLGLYGCAVAAVYAYACFFASVYLASGGAPVYTDFACGWVAVGLFGTALTLLVVFRDMPGGITFGSAPIGVCAALVLSGVILRRIACCREQPAISAGALARIS